MPDEPTSTAPALTAPAFANGHLLWQIHELAARLDTPKPPTPGHTTQRESDPKEADSQLAVLDLRPSAEIREGVIPGAQHLDIYGLGTTHTQPAVFDAFANMMRSLFAMRGAGSAATVVVYDEHSGMRAARAFYLLEYLGHKDVHLLDGGFNAWKAAGKPIATQITQPKRRRFQATLHPERFVGADELAANLENANWQVIDTRHQDEWLGKNTRGGPRGGTIPGALHIEWTRSLQDDGRFLPAPALTQLFAQYGIRKERTIVPFCQGGYRSSHTYLALRLLGYPHLRNFVGSWKEWGDRLDLPLVVPAAP